MLNYYVAACCSGTNTARHPAVHMQPSRAHARMDVRLAGNGCSVRRALFAQKLQDSEVVAKYTQAAYQHCAGVVSAIDFYIAKIAAEPSPSAAHVDEEVARLNVCVWFSSLPACGAESSAGAHKFVGDGL